jgi:hypothetical protein
MTEKGNEAMYKTQKQTVNSGQRKTKEQRRPTYELDKVTARLRKWSSQSATVELRLGKITDGAMIQLAGRIRDHGEHSFSVSFYDPMEHGLRLIFDLKTATTLACIDRRYRTVVLDEMTMVCLDEIAVQDAEDEIAMQEALITEDNSNPEEALLKS